MKKIITFLFFALLTACSGQTPPPPSTPTFVNTQTITIEGSSRINATILPSATVTPTFEPISTPVVATREPTNTPAILSPTVTLSSTIIARSTAQGVVTATYGFFKTQDAIDRQSRNDVRALNNTQVSSFPINCKEKVDYSYTESISPDGNWLAYTCGDHTIDKTLNIVSRDGKQWTLPYKDYLPKDQLIDMKPSSGVGPIHWLNGYLYFTPGLGGDWWGTCLYFAGNIALYRLDLKDGSVTATLPPSSSHPFLFYDFAFSPVGHKLAYIRGIGGNPVILDLITGEETEIVIHESDAGNLTWSPDGKEMAYATCQPSQDGADVAYSSIRIFSLDKHASKTIIEAEDYFYDRIMVSSRNEYLSIYDFRYRSYFHYIWSSKTLITPETYPMTPTPTPQNH